MVGKMRKWWQMERICTQCQCPWYVHMRISCEFRKVKRPIFEDDKVNELSEEKFWANVRQMAQEYAQEKETIQDVWSKMACILQEASLFMVSWLKMSI